MTMASNGMKYGKLSEEVSRERHKKNISPVQPIYHDTAKSVWSWRKIVESRAEFLCR